jgi:hypothetical protein
MGDEAFTMLLGSRAWRDEREEGWEATSWLMQSVRENTVRPSLTGFWFKTQEVKNMHVSMDIYKPFSVESGVSLSLRSK